MLIRSLGEEDTLDEEMAIISSTLQVLLPGEYRGQRSLAGYSPWSHKKSDKTEVTEHACTQSTGNSIQYSAMTCVLIESKKDWIDKYI